MDYNFDAIIDRTNTNSIKYDHRAFGKPEGAIPLWVADMDFMTAAPIIRALQKRCRHGIFGYSEIDDSYVKAIRHWYKKRYNWKIERDWLVPTPGVVFSICAAIRAFTAPGDPVIIQQPVYHPFMSAVTDNGRDLITSQLIIEDGQYTIDYWDFESQIIRNNIKLFLLCSPHNPVGRVWTRQELLRMGDICKRQGVTVISDEIHSDFVYSGHQHTVFADIDASIADITVTLTAPTKTFNIPGLQVANAFIPNDDLRARFVQEIQKTGVAGASLMGIAACRAAYERGAEWLDQLLPYLYGNITYLQNFIA